MSDSLSIDVSELVVMSQRYDGAATVVDQELKAAGDRAGRSIEGLAKRYVPKDTHTLERSIDGVARPIAGGMSVVVGTNLPYAEAVEKGRGAGKPMPPAGALTTTGWLRRHGIDASAEFVIRRAIGRRGIPPKPYLLKAFAELKPQIAAEFGAVSRRVLARLVAGR